MNAKLIFDFLFTNESEIFDKKLETNSIKKILFDASRALKHFDYDKIETRRTRDKDETKTKRSEKRENDLRFESRERNQQNQYQTFKDETETK